MAAFLQDDWKSGTRLTVNYGLRWEYYGRIKEKNNKQSLWLPSCNCMTVAGTGGLPAQLVDDDYNNFAPRFGFALRPFRDRTVIRGAGGIFYDSDMRHNAEVIGNPPFLLNRQYLSFLIPGLSLDNPFPANTGISTLQPVTLDRKYRDTYAEEWSLGFQHEMAPGFLADVSYVGNHLVKARRLRNLDQIVNKVQPYPGFAAIFSFEQAGTSSFNSLQARLERRMARGLSFISSYTWGHAIDDRPGQGSGRVQDFNNMRAERADADYDVRHRLSLSGVYELPFGHERRWGRDWSPAADTVLGGWSLNGIALLQGGRPFTVYLGQNNSLSGNFSDRPDAVQGVDWKPVNQGPDHWINPAAFRIPAAGTFGNLGRNTLRGPRLYNLDLSLAKETRVGERARMQIRAEFFNVLNHPNFSLPNATLDISMSPAALASFGVIPATVSPERQIQFGLRIEY